MRRSFLALSALVSILPISGHAKDVTEKLPKFSDFPVALMTGPKAPLRLAHEDMAFMTRFRQLYAAGIKSGPNFSGHYAVTDVGCGTYCTFLIAIDLKTGNTVTLDVPSGEDVYVCDDEYADGKGEVPGEIGNKFYFKPNSRLFIVTGKMPGNDCGARYFEERNGRMVLIRDFHLSKRK